MSECYSLVRVANKKEAWVSVTGNIELYNGVPQITSRNPLSWKTYYKN